jgi:hypothetical protein
MGTLPSCLLTLFDTLIQRLQDARIYGSNHIHRRIQFFLGHSRFPCIRKAPFYSGVAEAHHRHGQADEHLFAIRERFDGVGISIKSPKISTLQNVSLLSDSTPGLRSRIR